jgi:hypothetical protein
MKAAIMMKTANTDPRTTAARKTPIAEESARKARIADFRR